jgi:hypothetical protein
MATAEVDVADVVDETAAEEPASSSTARRCALVATVAAVLPILVAGVRGALRGWVPVGDDAYSAVRAWDVFSTHPPLLATWSSASMYTGHQINHPGPLQFDVLAIPVQLFGHGAGTAIGMALTNALAVAGIAWLASRRFGAAGTAWAMAFTAVLCWSMGSEMLYEPWSQFAPLLPFALFLVAVWGSASGDLVALPVMVAAGSYSFQTHLSYSVLVPGMAAFAVAVVVVMAWRETEKRRSTVRWLAITAGVGLVLWSQPIVEQFTADGEGNVAGLVRSSRADLPMPTTSMSLRAFGSTLAVPPFWLPPSYGEPAFGFADQGAPLWQAVGGLVILTALLGLFGWRAYRRGSVVVAAGSATALVALALGAVTTIRMPIYYGFIAATYARFMWPMGMVVWLALALAVGDELRSRFSTASWWSSQRLAVMGAGLAVVAGIATLPTVDHGAVGPPWTIDAFDALDDDVATAGEEAGSVLVDIQTVEGSLHMGPTVFSILQDAGVPFYVEDPALVRQLGEDRRFEPGKADARLTVRAGPDATDAPDGAHRVAQWRPDEERQVIVYLAPLDPED